MTDNKKSGIRLRHVEQLHDEKKRDLSPGAANRKKIFQKLPYQKIATRQDGEKIKTPKVEEQKMKVVQGQPMRESAQYQKLIQNLKRKSMEVQLRDNVIQSLNKQIDELKSQLRIKQNEVRRLNVEFQKLQKLAQSKSSKGEIQMGMFDSFRDPLGGYNYPPQPTSNFSADLPSKFNQKPFGTQNLSGMRKDSVEEVYNYAKETREYSNFGSDKKNNDINFGGDVRVEERMMKKQPPSSKATFGQPQKQQTQILSPFMALSSNNRKTEPSLVIYEPPQNIYQPFARISSNTSLTAPNFYQHNTNNHNRSSDPIKSQSNAFQNYSPYNNTSHSSSFSKKPQQFEFRQSRQKKGQQVNLDKFNIFGQDPQRKPAQKLTIEDSQEFKFQDIDNDF